MPAKPVFNEEQLEVILEAARRVFKKDFAWMKKTPEHPAAQEAFGLAIGVSQQSASALLKGKYRPGVRVASNIANRLKTTAAYTPRGMRCARVRSDARRMARSENYCRDCHHTWIPRGARALSAKCPSCKGDNVTFESLRHRAPEPVPPPPMYAPPPRRAPSPMSGLTKAVIAVVCVGGVLLVVAVLVIAAVGARLPKKSTTEQPIPPRATKR